MSIQIMVQNIPYGIKKEDFIDLISKTCNPSKINALHDLKGQIQGSAFVEYHTIEDARKSIEQINKINLNGNKLSAVLINNESNNSSAEQENSRDEDKDQLKKIYWKLHSNTDKLFEQIQKDPVSVLNNPIYSIYFDEDVKNEIRKLPRNRNTGQTRDGMSTQLPSENTFNQNAKSTENFDENEKHNTQSSRSNIPNSGSSPSSNFAKNDETQQRDFIPESENSKSFMYQSSYQRTSFNPEPIYAQNNDEIQKSENYPKSSFSYEIEAPQSYYDPNNDDELPQNGDFDPNNSMQQNGFNYEEDDQMNDQSIEMDQSSFQLDPEYMPSPNTHFTQQERANQRVFQENVMIIQSGNYTDLQGKQHDISEKVSSSISNSQTINKNFNFEKVLAPQLSQIHNWGRKEKKSIYSKIEVTNESTFEAARRIKRNIKEVCALNFASATKPGGGVINGRTAQEEALSRQSSLFFALKNQREMYDYHTRHTSPFYSDYMIYSPNVVVFRDDDNNLCYPIRVSVISSAAVNCSHISSRNRSEVYKTMKNRCRKILQLGMATNNKVMILGAFGCGVFGNRPEDISKIFKELLIDEFYGMFFSNIIFAIKGKGNHRNPNFDAFKSTFQSRGFFGF